ncbi:hypothetical protein DAKH74_009120 [Maudiozyma humilis]|uniref:CCT domain-containing protein n=1 Tax=Maudiozyma humilis TaxID=51915 RepID=A0AAV5RUI1_MAUHU|nr:hypothetical protein DAKH74_009120 [Kazachstania humilis]
MAATNKSKNAHSHAGSALMSFKLPNNVITKDDITPLSKHKHKSKGKAKVKAKKAGASAKKGSEVTGSNIADPEEEEREPEIVDSIPTEMKQAYSSATEGSEHGSSDDNNRDGLFSPLGSPMEDDDNELSYFSDEAENLAKFRSAATPLAAAPLSKSDQQVSQMLMNMNSLDFGASDLSMPFNPDTEDSHDDFWKEVKSTNEEAIALPANEHLGQSSAAPSFAYNSPSASPKAQFEAVSLDDFIADDLPATREASHEWNEKLFRESYPTHPVKLLSYRDGDGQLALRTRSLSNSTKNARMCIISKRKNKHKKLMKRAIRRKSGVAEMISTDVGISELML